MRELLFVLMLMALVAVVCFAFLSLTPALLLHERANRTTTHSSPSWCGNKGGKTDPALSQASKPLNNCGKKMLLHPTRTPRDFCIASCSTPASNSVLETRLTLRSELYPYCFVPPTQFSHNLNLLSLPTKQTSGHARLVPGAWRRFHLPAGLTGVSAWPHGR